MPRGGQNRKSLQRKIIRGTFRKDRQKKGPQPRLLERIPKPPGHLNKFGKALWRQIVPDLCLNQLLTALDIGTLEICCDAYGLYREARAAMLRSGKRSLRQYLDGQSSQTTPEATMMRQCWTTYKSLVAELGLSPAARMRMDLKDPKEPEKDPMARLLDLSDSEET